MKGGCRSCNVSQTSLQHTLYEIKLTSPQCRPVFLPSEVAQKPPSVAGLAKIG